MSCQVEGESRRKDGKVYCCKHYQQIRKYGRVLERTILTKNEIRVKGNICEMDLYGVNKEVVGTTIFDREFVNEVRKYKWSQIPRGYVRHVRGGVMLHRLILDAKQGDVVDHINRNPLDNRKDNLRIVSWSENGINKGKQSNNTSGYTGISYDKKNKKWKVRLNKNKKMIWLGRYSKIEEAIEARKTAESAYFGEYTPI